MIFSKSPCFFSILFSVIATVLTAESPADPGLSIEVQDTVVRLKFALESGQAYEIQRSSTLSSDWEVVSEGTASGSEIVYISTLDAPRIFWRIVSIDGNGEVLEISDVVVSYILSGEQADAILQVDTQSSETVNSVVFYDGNIPMGSASPSGSNVWTFQFPWDPDQPETYAFSARATSSTNATATSSVSRLLLADPSRFIPLDDAGNPQPGQFVGVNPDGTLRPFLYRPEGSLITRGGFGLELEFGDGTVLELVDGHYTFSFAHAVLRMDAAGVRQFSQSGSEVHQLQIDALEPTSLRAAFGISSDVDLILETSDGFPLRWKGGALGGTGIAGLDVEPQLPEGLPLPDTPLGTYTIEDVLTGRTQLAFAYAGKINLGTTTIEIPSATPFVFTWDVASGIQLQGGAKVTLPGGAAIRAKVSFAHPTYAFEFDARSIELPLAGALTDLLPTNAAESIPSGDADHAERVISIKCLNAYDRAIENFIRTSLSYSNDTEPTTALLPQVLNGGASIAEAWSWRILAGAELEQTLTIPAPVIDTLRDFILQTSRKASAAPDLAQSVDHLEGIIRLRASIQKMGAGSVLASIEADLIDAEQFIREALTVRLGSSDPAQVTLNLGPLLTSLIDAGKLYQSEGTEVPTDWESLILECADRHGRVYLQQLGIEPDEFDPTLNDAVLALDRYSVYQALHTVLLIEAGFAVINLDPRDEGLPVDEAYRQLATRLLDLHALDVADALSRHNLRLFQAIMYQRLDLIAQIELLGLSDLQGLSDLYDNQALFDRFNELAEELLEGPSLSRDKEGLLGVLRFTLRLLEHVPAQASNYAEDNFEILDDILNEFYSGGHLNPSLTADDLFTWLEATVLHDRMRRHYFYNTAAVNANADAQVDNQSRLAYITERLAGSVNSSDNSVLEKWQLLARASELLLAELSDLESVLQSGSASGAATDQLGYFNAEASLINAYTAAATKLYQQTAGAPGTLPNIADILLPGNLRIHQLSGSGSLDLSSGFFSASFTGALELPESHTRLTVERASINSFGRMELQAYGQTSFASGDTAFTFEIPRRRPLAVIVDPVSGTSVSGSGRIELPNQAYLEGYMSLDHPDYAFGIALGGGFRIQLAKEITLIRPNIDTLALATLPREAISGLTEFYTKLAGGLDSMVNSASDLSDFNELEPGEAPEFEVPTTTLPLDLIDAWAVSFLNQNVHDRVNGSLSSGAEELKKFIENLSDDAANARAAIAPTLLNLQRLQRINNANQRMIELIDNSAFKAATSDDEAQAKLAAQVHKSAEDLVKAAADHLNLLPDEAQPGEIASAGRIYLRAQAQLAAVGGTDPIDSGPIIARIDQSLEQLFQTYGLKPDGTVTDTTKAKAIRPEDARFLRLVIANYYIERVAIGDDQDFTPIYLELSRRESAAVILNYAQAKANGDLEDQMEWAAYLNFLIRDKLESPFPVEGLDDNALGFDLMAETLRTLHQRYGSSGQPTPEQRKLASSLIEAANHLHLQKLEQSQRRAADYLAKGSNGYDQLEWKQPERSMFDDIIQLGKHLSDAQQLPTESADEVKGTLTAFFDHFAESLAADLEDPEFATNSLKTASDSLLVLIDLLTLAHEAFPENIELIGRFEQTWSAIHLEWTQVAEARKAWWLLGAYSQRLTEAAANYQGRVSAELITLLETRSRDAMLGLARTVEAMSVTLNNSVGLEAFDFPLPGDLQVDRLYGDLAFNVDDGSWNFGFGGQLKFPEIGLTFAIPSATFDSSGNFFLSLLTRGPIDFGLVEGLTIDVSNAFQLGGNFFDASITSAEVDAGVTLAIAQSGGGNTEYDVRIAYTYMDSVNPNIPGQHRFGFSTLAEGAIEVYTEDFVIFRGGLGFDLYIDEFGQPQQGTFDATVTAGILAIQKPLPNTPKLADFQLAFSGTLSATQSATDTILALRQGGFLQLPPTMVAQSCDPQGNGSNPPDPTANDANRPSVTLTSDLSFTYHNSNHPTPALRDTIEFAGSVGFSDLRFSIPEVPDLWVDVCSLNLEFGYDSSSGLPTGVLSDVDASISLPLPDGKSAKVALEVGRWSLDRLPDNGAIFLDADLDLFDQGGLKLAAKGGRNSQNANQPFTGLYLDLDDTPTLSISGSFEVTVTDWFQDTEGEPVTMRNAASGEVTIQLPTGGNSLQFEDVAFELNDLQVALDGEFHLGNASSLIVTDPRLKVVNPLRIFQPTVSEPFILEFDMGVGFATDAGVSFTVQAEEAQIIFDGESPVPLYKLASVGGCVEGATDPDGQPISILGDLLPFKLQKFCIEFDNLTPGEARPLIPETPEDLPLFSLDNVKVTISAGIEIPEEKPVIFGQFTDLQVGFSDGKPKILLDGIGLGVDLSEYLTDKFPFGGIVYLGGLNTGNLFFAGKVSASIKGNMVEGIVALDKSGPRGLCIGLAGAEAAIPIGYGFVLSGVQGGIAIRGGSADPCDFVDLMDIDPVTGRPKSGAVDGGEPPIDFSDCPLITWEELLELKAETLNREARELKSARVLLYDHMVTKQGFSRKEAAEIMETVESAEDVEAFYVALSDENAIPVECPVAGQCPPASLGFLAQPHPDSFDENSPYYGRNIFKMTSISEEVLNTFGINRDLVAGLVPNINFDLEELSLNVASDLRQQLEAIVPPPPDNLPQPLPDWATDFEDDLEETMNRFELGIYNGLTCAIEKLNLPNDREELIDAIYAAIVETAYAGVEYDLDITYRLTGSFSYTGISSFASVTGGIVYSTTLTTGLVGSVNIFGVPVGTANLFVGALDGNGNPSPFFCGDVKASLGPISFGELALLYDCPNCAGKVFTAVGTLIGDLSQAYVYGIMEQIAPDLASEDLNPFQHWNLLETDDQKFAFVTQLVTHPPNISGEATLAFREFLINLADAIQPRIAGCAEFNPKLFGFSLSGSDNAPLSYRFYQGPVDLDDPQAGYKLYVDSTFSPIGLFNRTITYVTGLAPLTFFGPLDFDHATFAYQWQIPSLGSVIGDAFVKTPDQFIIDQVDSVLSHSTMTLDYQLAPFGLELARSGGRVIFPSFDHHPKGPNPKPYPPDVNPALPSRMDVIWAILGGSEQPNRLADATWSGEPGELEEVFAGTEFESVSGLSGLSLTDDYFPYGGLLGASELKLPRLITDPIPYQIGILTNPNITSLSQRLEAAQGVLNQITQSRTVGQFSFYLPAPNPPLPFPGDADAFLRSLTEFNPDTSAIELYPADEIYFKGWFDSPILGIPTIRSEFEYSHLDGVLRVYGVLPEDSWLTQFSGETSLLFEMTPGSRVDDTLVDILQEDKEELDSLVSSGTATPETINQQIDAFIGDLTDKMPKIHALAEVNEWIVPGPNYLPTDTEVSDEKALMIIDQARFEVFSPRYDVDAVGNDPVNRAKREGGIAFEGSIRFAQEGLAFGNAYGSFSLTPNTGPQFLLPGYSGRFHADSVRIGTLDLSAPGQGVDVQFDATYNSAYLGIDVAATSIPLGVADLIPASGEREIDLNFNVNFNNTTSVPAFNLTLSPSELSSPLFGDDTQVLIHGANRDTDFTIKSVGFWSANITVVDPEIVLKVGSTTFASIKPNGTNDPITGTITGNGGSINGIYFTNLPLGTTIETFPKSASGSLQRQTFKAGIDGSANLTLQDNGAFSLILLGSGSRTVSGLNNAELESGYTFIVSNQGVFLNAKIDEMTYPGLFTLQPLESDSDQLLDINATLTQSGASVSIDPALFQFFNPAGIQTEMVFHGGFDKSGNYTKATFNTSGAWSAQLDVGFIAIDADGTGQSGFPTLLTVQPSTVTDTLFTATINGTGLSSASFTATRSGAVDFVLFPNQSTQYTYDKVSLGSQSLSMSTNGNLAFNLSGFSSKAMFFGTMPVGSGSVGLIGFGSSSGSSLSYTNGNLRFFINNPGVYLAGESIGGAIDSVTMNTDLFGDVSIDLSTNSNLDLFGPMLQLRTGTHSVRFSIDDLGNTLTVNALGRFNLKVPTFNGSTFSTQTLSEDFTFAMEDGTLFSYSWDPPSNFGLDLDWLRIVAGGAGRVRIAATLTGLTVGVENFDAYVFGKSFNDVGDFTFSTSGAGLIALPDTLLDFAKDQSYWLQIDPGNTMPLSWNSSAGTISLQLPSSLKIKVLGTDVISFGTFITGLGIPESITIPTDGTFDFDFSRSISVNGASFGSLDVNFRRTSSGNLYLEIDDQIGNSGWTGARFDFYVRAGPSSGSFYARLNGSVAFPAAGALLDSWDRFDGSNDEKLKVGSFSMSLQNNAASQFSGTVTILGSTFDAQFGSGLSQIFPISGLGLGTFIAPNF